MIYIIISSIAIFLIIIAAPRLRGKLLCCNQVNYPIFCSITKQRVAISIFLALIFSFIYGVRLDVGTDFNSYQSIFERTFSNNPAKVEPLYEIISKFFIVTGLGFHGLMAFMAFLVFFPLFLRLTTITRLAWLGFIIVIGSGFLFQATNHVRFIVVSAFLFFSYDFIVKKNLKIWTLMIALASGFHYTAILYYPLYWVVRRRINPLIWLSLLIIGSLVFFIKEFAIYLIFASELLLPQGFYANYPSGYALKAMEHQDLGFGGFLYMGLFVLVFYLTVFFKRDQEFHVYANLSMLGLFLALALYYFGSIQRLAGPLILAMAFFVPLAISGFKKGISRDLVILNFFVLYAGLFLLAIWGGSHNALPYNWIFG